MSKTITIYMIILLAFNILVANPIPIIEYYLNELLLDPDDSKNWIIEITNYNRTDLSTYYLTSQSDTAYFKDGINWNKDYIIINQDSMKSNLNLYHQGDVLSIHSSIEENYVWDQIRFGDVEFSEVSSPIPGQSICLYSYTGPYYMENYYYFLANTPTIGNENEREKGTIEGYIKDNYGNCLENVAVIYDYMMDSSPVFAITDSAGYYCILVPSKRQVLSFDKDGYFRKDTTLQVWPDSTIAIYCMMNNTSSIDDEISKPLVSSFSLEQNYPNPFNSQTTIEYYLPLSDYIEISIYDLTGRRVETLVSAYKHSGGHQVTWNANEVSSGIYIYKLSTSQGTVNRKCFLIK